MIGFLQFFYSQDSLRKKNNLKKNNIKAKKRKKKDFGAYYNEYKQKLKKCKLKHLHSKYIATCKLQSRAI